MKEGKLDELPKFFETRFPQAAESVDGILCWDVMDFLDRPAANALAPSLTRILRPDGALLGFFSTAEGRAQVYTKYIVVDDTNLRYQTYPAAARAAAQPAQSRHHQDVRRAARDRLVPDEEQRPRDPVPQARLSVQSVVTAGRWRYAAASRLTAAGR